MKKILLVVLALACALAFASCELVNNVTTDPGEDFIKAIANTDPTTATINTVTTTELGTLNGEYLVTYGADGAATIDYSYEKWYLVGEGNGTDLKYTVTGTITRQQDGSYADGKGFTANVSPAATGFTLDLTSVIDSAEINAAYDTLTATVAAADTEAVLGVALGYDVELTVVIGSGVVETITVTFADGTNSGSISCRYR